MAKAEHPNAENVGATVEPVAADAVRAGGSNSLVIAEIYAEAADTIADPNSYVVGFTARRPDVDPQFDWACFARDPRATRWGMSGAIEKAAYKRKWKPREAVALVYRLAADLGVRRLAEWSEAPHRTHTEAVAALRAAALRAEAAR